MIKNLILVAIGGAFGSALRYLIHWMVNKKTTTQFPTQTFIVNLIGCLLIGLLIGYFAKNQNDNESLKLLLITGFCGGFTTFSTFASENISLIRDGVFLQFALYTSLSVFVGLLATYLGILITKLI